MWRSLAPGGMYLYWTRSFRRVPSSIPIPYRTSSPNWRVRQVKRIEMNLGAHFSSEMWDFSVLRIFATPSGPRTPGPAAIAASGQHRQRANLSPDERFFFISRDVQIKFRLKIEPKIRGGPESVGQPEGHFRRDILLILHKIVDAGSGHA